MKFGKTSIAALVLILIMIFSLTACGNAAARVAVNPLIEMELTENYDTSDPFIHEKLFCVSENIATLDLEISFQMQGESGVLEIADNETEQVYWGDNWSGNVEYMQFTATLNALDKEKEYVVRFTGAKISNAKIVIDCDNSLVSERERPKAK